MNSNLITIGTLVLTVFVAGSHFGSGMQERAELRKEIAELKASQAELMTQVRDLNKEYDERKTKFVAETQSLNQKINTISTEKRKVSTALVENNKRIDEHKEAIEFNLSRLNKYIASNTITMKPDTAHQNIQ